MQSSTRVAVIGGGIVGLSIAWRLSQAGASVTLFEAGRLGNEASWAGAGMLAPGGEFEEKSLWSELALESLALYPGFVEELEQESDQVIDFRKCGAFEAAFTDHDAEALRARAARQGEIGIYSEQFPAGRIPGLRAGAAAAQYYPHDSIVNPRDVVRALAFACERGGVRIREFEPVRTISANMPFDAFVLTAGAWSSQVAIVTDQGVSPAPEATPVRGHLIAFEEWTGLCDPILRHGSTYLLRRANNIVIAGASTEEAGFDRTIDGTIASRIAANAAALIPALDNRSYTAWNGLRPGSATGHPVIGRLANSQVWLAYGHNRNGILLAPATARGIAREIMIGDASPASSQTDLLLPASNRQ